jgi:hypothetical protein
MITVINAYDVRNEWSSMFPSRDSDIGSDLPLWAVQDDGSPGVSTVDTFMGGWTSALAKQYLLPGNGLFLTIVPQAIALLRKCYNLQRGLSEVLNIFQICILL